MLQVKHAEVKTLSESLALLLGAVKREVGDNTRQMQNVEMQFADIFKISDSINSSHVTTQDAIKDIKQGLTDLENLANSGQIGAAQTFQGA